MRLADAAELHRRSIPAQERVVTAEEVFELRVLAAGPTFVQNLRRGDYEIVRDKPGRRRLGIAFRQLAMAV
jgi:hypothetical protein